MSNDSSSSKDRIEQKIKRCSISTGFVVSFFMVATQPVAAQSSGGTANFCDIQFVGPLINSAFSIFVTGALAVGLLTWVVTSFTESLPLPQDTKKSIKKHRNTGLVSMARAILVPALVLALLSATSIGIPSCISVLP